MKVKITGNNFEFAETKYHGNSKKIGGYISNDNCYICTTHKTKDGFYPRVHRKGNDYRAHRYIYEEQNGKIQGEMVVRHTCDNTFCINPDHLILGTHKDNMRDKVLRGRQPKGSECKNAKLNEEQVYEIRFNSEGKTVKELAEEYGVSSSTIFSIKKGKSWVHVIEHKIIAA